MLDVPCSARVRGAPVQADGLGQLGLGQALGHPGGSQPLSEFVVRGLGAVRFFHLRVLRSCGAVAHAEIPAFVRAALEFSLQVRLDASFLAGPSQGVAGHAYLVG